MRAIPDGWVHLELPPIPIPDPWWAPAGFRRDMDCVSYIKSYMAHLGFEHAKDYLIGSLSFHHGDKVMLYLAPDSNQYANWILLNWIW